MPHNRVVDSLVNLVKERVGDVQALYLFGSHADGTNHGDSDLDLAFLAPLAVDAVKRWELQEELASLAGCNVDLVDLRAASTVMQIQVLRSSRLLLDREPSKREAFESHALSDYARLNKEREGILADIEAAGSIYG